MFGFAWAIAFILEFSSSGIGIPFGDYFYTGSPEGQELYLSNIPFMHSDSFILLLFADYCVALVFVLPHAKMAEQRGWHFDAVLGTSWLLIHVFRCLVTWV